MEPKVRDAGAESGVSIAAGFDDRLVVAGTFAGTTTFAPQPALMSAGAASDIFLAKSTPDQLAEPRKKRARHPPGLSSPKGNRVDDPGEIGCFLRKLS